MSRKLGYELRANVFFIKKIGFGHIYLTLITNNNLSDVVKSALL